MQTTISKWGNSQGLRIPKEFVKDLHIHIGDKVNISLEKRKIIIEAIKPEKVKYDLKHLLAQMPDDYQAAEILSDKQGSEQW